MIDAPSITTETKMLSRDEEARRARLRQIRVEKGYRSARAASAALGLPESSFRSHENGSRPIREDAARLYAEKFNVNYSWLWNGLGDRLESNLRLDGYGEGNHQLTLANAIPYPIRPTTSGGILPIRGRARGGDGGEIVLDGTVADHLPGPAALEDVEGAYGVEIVGDSMAPRYLPGEIVWAHPARSAHKGDFVILQVRQDNGELHAFVKRFVRYSNGSVIVCQFNPEKELVFDREDVEAMHLIVGSGIR